VGKKADPEDIEAAKDDKTVVIMDKEDGHSVVDATGPPHHGGARLRRCRNRGFRGARGMRSPTARRRSWRCGGAR